MDKTLILVCWVAGLTFARIPPAIPELLLRTNREVARHTRSMLNAAGAFFSFAITILLLPMLLIDRWPGSTNVAVLTIRQAESMPRRYADYLPSNSTVSRTPGTETTSWIGDMWTFVGTGACLYLISLGVALTVSYRSIDRDLRPPGIGRKAGFGILLALTAVLAMALSGLYAPFLVLLLAAIALLLLYQASVDYRSAIALVVGHPTAPPLPNTPAPPRRSDADGDEPNEKPEDPPA